MKIDDKWLDCHKLKASINTEFDEKKNIIVGPNGGGKTRFLHAVMDYYEKEKNYAPHQIVFADFPHLIYKDEISEKETSVAPTLNLPF